MNWNEYISLLPWGLIGAFSYWLSKYTTAYSRPDFKSKIFFKRNLMHLINSAFAMLALIAMLSEGILDFVFGNLQKPEAVAIAFGAGGSSILKALINGFVSLVKIAISKYLKK